MNIIVNYRNDDDGWRSVVVEPGSMEIESFRSAVAAALSEGRFVPSRVGLPGADAWYEIRPDWILTTNNPATVDFTAEELVERLRNPESNCPAPVEQTVTQPEPIACSSVSSGGLDMEEEPCIESFKDGSESEEGDNLGADADLEHAQHTQSQGSEAAEDSLRSLLSRLFPGG